MLICFHRVGGGWTLPSAEDLDAYSRCYPTAQQPSISHRHSPTIRFLGAETKNPIATCSSFVQNMNPWLSAGKISPEKMWQDFWRPKNFKVSAEFSDNTSYSSATSKPPQNPLPPPNPLLYPTHPPPTPLTNTQKYPHSNPTTPVVVNQVTP